MDAGRIIIVDLIFWAVGYSFAAVFAATDRPTCTNPVGILPVDDTIEMPALGYEFYLGMPYDAVNNKMINFKRVCGEKDLEALTVEEKLSSPKIELSLGQRFDTITEKMGPKGMNMPDNLQLSIATGLLDAYHEGLWLYEGKPSRNEAQVTTIKRYEWFTRSLKTFAKHQCYTHYYLLPLATGATHYVSKISYGYQQITTLKKNLGRNDKLSREQTRNVLGSISKVLALTPDVDSFELPDGFTTQNLNGTMYTSGQRSPKNFMSDFSGLLVYNRDQSNPDQRYREQPYQITITLQRLPKFSAHELFTPTTSLISAAEDFRMTEADFKDAVRQARQLSTIHSVDTGEVAIKTDGEMSTYLEITQAFDQNYERFKGLYQGWVKDNLRQLRKDFKYVKSSSVTGNATDLECSISDLESTRRSSPFSNYVTQVWSEIIHREIEAVNDIVNFMEKSNALGSPWKAGAGERRPCSDRVYDKEPCFVELTLHSDILNQKSDFLKLQDAWLSAVEQGVSFSLDTIEQFANKDGPLSQHAEIFKDDHNALRSGKHMIDAAWDDLSTKIDHAGQSLKHLKKLGRSCKDNLQYIVNMIKPFTAKSVPVMLGNGEVLETKGASSLVKIRLNGNCSNLARNYFDFQE